MRVWTLVAAVVVGFAGLVQAAPVDFKAVSADATWVAHMDIDAVRASTVVDKMYKQVAEKWKDIDKHMDKAREQWGLDPRKDLHGMTMYGPKVGEHKGVMIAYVDVDRKVLEGKAEKAPDHKTTKYGAYEIHSWTGKMHGKDRPAAGAFYKSNVIVFSGSVDEVKAALDVLDGKKPALAGKDSALTAKVPAGATVIARAVDLAGNPKLVKCPVLRDAETMSISMGESDGKSFFDAKLVNKSAEVAQQMKAVLDGFKAMAQLRHGGDAGAKKLIDQCKATVEGKTISVAFSAPADEVWAQMQKCAKEMKEHRQKWMQHRKAPEGKKKGDEKK